MFMRRHFCQTVCTHSSTRLPNWTPCIYAFSTTVCVTAAKVILLFIKKKFFLSDPYKTKSDHVIFLPKTSKDFPAQHKTQASQ